MSVGVFLVSILFGAGAIAVWIDARFPKLAPADGRLTLLHGGVALVVARLVPGGMGLVLGGGSPIQALVAIFGVAFPALTYALLVSIWMIKLAQRTLGGAFR